jgi:hypothetical protein
MGYDPLCSFCDATPYLEDETMTSIVSVMLGLSEEETDVSVALRWGPIRFLSYLAGVDLACSVARVVCDEADAGESSFPIPFDDVRQLIEYYLVSRFNTSSTVRIGAQGAYNFQRLVYNTSACVVSYYHDKLRCCQNNKEARSTHVRALRRATAMVAEFADAVKDWLPVSPWIGGWWTRWHVLAYTMEMTTGTILCEKPREPHTLAFLVFCDTVVEHVLCEWRDASFQSIADYHSSSFAWCACSKAWQTTLRNGRHLSTPEFIPHAHTFLTVTANVFNSTGIPSSEFQSRPSSPHIADGASSLNRKPRSSGKRAHEYDSPVTDRKVASRVSAVDADGIESTKRSIAL